MIEVGADTHPHTQTERVLQALLDDERKNNSVNYSIRHDKRT